MILIDTSVWIDFLNAGRDNAATELDSLIRADAPLAITAVVIVEILQGLRRDAAIVSGVLRRFPLLEPAGFETYARAAAISREARFRGASPSTVNCLIASIALEFDAELFTLDRDFERLTFCGIRLYQGSA